LRPRATRHDQSSALRAAFSLIELVVVILIIGILASLILAGVQSAMKQVRVTQVVVEFGSLEKAITDFKAKYGSIPPSGITLYETPADWTPATAGRSRAAIKQVWPDFSFTVARDINGDGDTSDTIILNGAECLVFFLGGVNATNVVDRSGAAVGPPVNTPITSWEPLGFSTNPANPFARGGSRVGPFYQFDVARLGNRDGAADAEGFPEYRDELPGQTVNTPILYASSYEGKGYRDSDVGLTGQPAYDAYATLPTGFAYAYRRYTGSTYPVPVANYAGLEAFNPKSFQLISPGIDGEYGWGGVLNTSMELAEPRTERTYERDNITNFKGGVLN
jgi:general secretion pathway protein G